jgi:hypothetical protein
LEYWWRGWALKAKGDISGAVTAFEKARALESNPMVTGGVGWIYAVAGRRTEAEKILGQLEETSRQRYVPAVPVAGIYFGLGDRDRGFQWMEKGYRDRSFFMTGLKWQVWDPYRSDPRFIALYKKVGLPE